MDLLLRDCVKEEKKEHKYTTQISFYENAYYPTYKKISYIKKSVNMLILKLQGIECDLSVMRIG